MTKLWAFALVAATLVASVVTMPQAAPSNRGTLGAHSSTLSSPTTRREIPDANELGASIRATTEARIAAAVSGASATAGANRTIDDFVPTADQVPSGLELFISEERTRAEVAMSIAGSDPAALADAEQMLDEWEANSYREFVAPDPLALPPVSTTYINVSIHQFSSPEGASEALNYFSDVVVVAQVLAEIGVDSIGDQTRVLHGEGDAGVNVVAYVRAGRHLIRVGRFSPGGDPTQDVLTLASVLVEDRAPTEIPTGQTATPDLLLTVQARATAEAQGTQTALAQASAASIDATQASRVATAAVGLAATGTAAAAAAAGTAIAQEQRVRELEAALAILATSEADYATAAASGQDQAVAAQATIEAWSTRSVASPVTSPTATARPAASPVDGTLPGSSDSETATAAAANASSTIAALDGRVTELEAALVLLATREADSARAAATAQAEMMAAQMTVTAREAVPAANSLDPASREESIQTDLNGMIRGTSGARDDALEQLRQVLEKYQTGCRAGFVLISGSAPDVEPGVALAQVVQRLLVEHFAGIFGDAATETFALPGAQPFGEVGLQIFFYQGCQPAA